MTDVTRYPLCWPIGWGRTTDPQYGRFSTKQSRNINGFIVSKGVTLHQALQRIDEEVRRFSKPGRPWRIYPDEVIISTNLQTRLDGLPRGNQKMPDDPGVAVYFELDGKPQCVACDNYTTIEQNLAGVAATLFDLRSIERHGSGLMARAFTGFAALPHLAEEPWHVVLNVDPAMPWSVIEKQAKVMRSQSHPDKGGDATQFDRVCKAFELAKAAR